jgi:hypothetical protein
MDPNIQLSRCDPSKPMLLRLCNSYLYFNIIDKQLSRSIIMTVLLLKMLMRYLILFMLCILGSTVLLNSIVKHGILKFVIEKNLK